jgi:hypothetical protein
MLNLGLQIPKSADMNINLGERKRIQSKNSNAISQLSLTTISLSSADCPDSIRPCLVCNHLEIQQSLSIPLALLQSSSKKCYSCKLLETITIKFLSADLKSMQCTLTIFPEPNGLPFHGWIYERRSLLPRIEFEVFMPQGK